MVNPHPKPLRLLHRLYSRDQLLWLARVVRLVSDMAPRTQDSCLAPIHDHLSFRSRRKGSRYRPSLLSYIALLRLGLMGVGRQVLFHFTPQRGSRLNKRGRKAPQARQGVTQGHHSQIRQCQDSSATRAHGHQVSMALKRGRSLSPSRATVLFLSHHT